MVGAVLFHFNIPQPRRGESLVACSMRTDIEACRAGRLAFFFVIPGLPRLGTKGLRGWGCFIQHSSSIFFNQYSTGFHLELQNTIPKTGYFG